MELHLKILPHLSTHRAKVMHKTDDSVCVRQAISPRNQPSKSERRCPYLRPLRIRLGTDPAGDAATLASVLWGRKGQATSLYLFVRPDELTALEDPDYLAKFRKAFNHCTRRSTALVCTLILVAK